MVSPKTRDWLQLVRLPNVFTAMADPLAGALAVGATWRDSLGVISVMIAAACFYAFGLVLNDWNDYRRDLKERPYRPLPTGRIRRWEAFLAALVLMAAGLGPAFIAGSAASGVAVLLIAAIVMYDVLLKEVPIAPGIMGICRGLNLLMGMMAVDPEHWKISGGMRFWFVLCMGVYVCGVTIFARREAAARQGYWPAVGAVVAWSGVLGLALLPMLFNAVIILPAGFLWCAVLLGLTGYGLGLALLRPSPERVQPAVKTAVLGIIVLDAAVVGFTRGFVPSLPVLLLLIPALLIGRWLYST